MIHQPQTLDPTTLKRETRKPRRRLMPGILCVVTMCGIAVIVAAANWQHKWWFYWQHKAQRAAFVRRPATPTAAQIVSGAKSQEGTLYDATYLTISYPNGDVPRAQGACTDVVVRALRNAGYDLQRLIHEDMQRNFSAYPHKWGLDKPDPNIDHRRVPNQMRFLQRHGLSLTTTVSPQTLAQWQPGDFVYWDTGNQKLHTGVVSDTCNSVGVPFVVHNGYVCIEQDCLTRWKIIGHFRYPKSTNRAKTTTYSGLQVSVATVLVMLSLRSIYS